MDSLTKCTHFAYIHNLGVTLLGGSLKSQKIKCGQTIGTLPQRDFSSDTTFSDDKRLFQFKENCSTTDSIQVSLTWTKMLFDSQPDSRKALKLLRFVNEARWCGNSLWHLYLILRVSALVIAMFEGNNTDNIAIALTILGAKASVPINIYYDKIRFWILSKPRTEAR